MESKAGSNDNTGAILAALATMQSNVATKEKTAAHEYLERFQKSVRGNYKPYDGQRTDRRIGRSLEHYTYDASRSIDYS